MNNIYISIVLLCVIIIICLIFIFSGKKSKNPKEAFSSSYLTKDELSDVIRGKITVSLSLSDSSKQYKIYYNVDNTIKVETIKNGIIEGITNGTYNIISKNNAGYIENNFINIHESPNINSRFNKQHPNSIYKTMKYITGPYTLYQHITYSDTLAFKDDNNNDTYFSTVYPQNPNEAVSSSYLTKDELSDVIRGKITVSHCLYDSSRQYKCYYNVDNTFKVETIKNGIIEGITNGTYNIISKNNAGYIENNFINIDESPNITSRFNKQHPNSIYKTMKNIIGPFTLYQNSIKGQTLSYKSSDSNTYFNTVFPQ